jgi:hypothetical protein
MSRAFRNKVKDSAEAALWRDRWLTVKAVAEAGIATASVEGLTLDRLGLYMNRFLPMAFGIDPTLVRSGQLPNATRGRRLIVKLTCNAKGLLGVAVYDPERHLRGARLYGCHDSLKDSLPLRVWVTSLPMGATPTKVL